ncbi:hypothetical protein D3C76_1134060 [compost metagenome]
MQACGCRIAFCIQHRPLRTEFTAHHKEIAGFLRIFLQVLGAVRFDVLQGTELAGTVSQGNNQVVVFIQTNTFRSRYPFSGQVRMRVGCRGHFAPLSRQGFSHFGKLQL